MYAILVIIGYWFYRFIYDKGIAEGKRQYRILRDQSDREEMFREIASYEKLVAEIMTASSAPESYNQGLVAALMQERFRLLTIAQAKEMFQL